MAAFPYFTAMPKSEIRTMLKICSLTQRPYYRKHLIPHLIPVNGGRTLSVLQNAGDYRNCGCVNPGNHWKSLSVLRTCSLEGNAAQTLSTFPPTSEATPPSNILTDELNDGKGDQETFVDVEHKLFHFHSECQPETISNVTSSFTVVASFITTAEEEILMKEVEPHLKRLKYEFDHWDDAIHGFREIEKTRWSQQASSVLNRVHKAAFPDSCQKLPQTHVLDLAKSGVIKPHVDSVRFCGNIICGLCLLSDAVMRLRHVELKNQVVDVLLRRGSLYIMRDEARYNFTHEVLGEEESFFRDETVMRGRRVSIMSRNQPTEQSPVGSSSHSQEGGEQL